MSALGRCRYCGLPVAVSDAAMTLLRALVHSDKVLDIQTVADDLVCDGGPCFWRWQGDLRIETRKRTDEALAVCTKIRRGESGRIPAAMMRDSEFSRWVKDELYCRRRKASQQRGQKTTVGEPPKEHEHEETK